jgi:hypothetical protein
VLGTTWQISKETSTAPDESMDMVGPACLAVAGPGRQ